MRTLPKICLILPYFGKLPSYWDGFIDSCEDNRNIDFLIVTDCATNESLPSNIYIKHMTWPQMQAKLKSRLAQLGYQKVCISWPYKLCDYKPTYGYLFAEELRNYDYWGYIDYDLIFGNIEKFLRRIALEKYDRVFRYGHLSIYRNREDINLLFTKAIGKEINFRNYANSAFIYNFDENGMNRVFVHHGYQFLDCSFDATFQIYDYAYRWRNRGQPSRGELFVKEADGSTTVYTEKDNGSIECVEVCYIHYMTKKRVHIDKDCPRPYAITHNGTICLENTSSEVILNAIKQYTYCTEKQQSAFISSEIRRLRKETINKIILSLRYKGLKTFAELCTRFKSWYRHRKSYLDKHR